MQSSFEDDTDRVSLFNAQVNFSLTNIKCYLNKDLSSVTIKFGGH